MYITKQLTQKDCGLHVIQSLIHEFHNKKIALDTLRNKSNMTQEGLSIKSIIELGSKLGIVLEPYQIDIKQLGSYNGLFVSLVLKDGNSHFHIGKRVKNKIRVYDLDSKKKYYKLEEYNQFFQGIILSIKPSIFPNEIKENKWNVSDIVLKNKWALVWMAIGTLTTIFISFIVSMFSKIVIDKIIPVKNQNYLVLCAITFTCLLVINILIKVINGYVSKKIETLIEYEIKKEFVSKLVNAKRVSLYKVTMVDTLRKFSYIDSVASFYTNYANALLSEFCTFVVSVIILLIISPSLFSIVFCAGVLIASTTFIFYRVIKGVHSEVIKHSIIEGKELYDIVNSNYSNTSNTQQNWITGNWIKSYGTRMTKNYRIWVYKAWQSSFDSLLMSVLPIAVTSISAILIIHDKMSLGTMVMFNVATRYFIGPIKELSVLTISYPITKRYLDMIKGHMSLEQKEDSKGDKKLGDISSIEIDNLRFGYDKNILSVDKFYIDKSFRLNGANGRGKSTFLKIISGNLEARGYILFSGVNLDRLDLNDLYKKILYINPQTYIPNSTVLDYICDGQKTIKDNFLEECERKNLFGLFKEMGVSLSAKIENNGANFSSGQRQFILFMKYFSRDYSLVIMDEALENVNVKIVDQIRHIIKEGSIWIEVGSDSKILKAEEVIEIEKINTN